MRLASVFSCVGVEHSRKYAQTFSKPSLAVQAEKENCDINVIVRRFGQGSQIPMIPREPFERGAYVDICDYRTAMDAVRAGKEAFMRLPAQLRKRFAHDPQVYMEFVADPKNFDEMVRLGMATKKEPPKEEPKGDVKS